jgi:hypothetical protein
VISENKKQLTASMTSRARVGNTSTLANDKHVISADLPHSHVPLYTASVYIMDLYHPSLFGVQSVLDKPGDIHLPVSEEITQTNWNENSYNKTWSTLDCATDEDCCSGGSGSVRLWHLIIVFSRNDL